MDNQDILSLQQKLRMQNSPISLGTDVMQMDIAYINLKQIKSDYKGSTFKISFD